MCFFVFFFFFSVSDLSSISFSFSLLLTHYYHVGVGLLVVMSDAVYVCHQTRKIHLISYKLCIKSNSVIHSFISTCCATKKPGKPSTLLVRQVNAIYLLGKQRLYFLFFYFQKCVDALGGKCSCPLPQPLSLGPRCSSSTPPSVKKLCVSQLFINGCPLSVAFWMNKFS